MKIRLVITTRVSEKDFFNKTATGKSLSLKMPALFEIRLFANNKNEITQEILLLNYNIDAKLNEMFLKLI